MGYRSNIYVAIVPSAGTAADQRAPVMDRLRLLVGTTFAERLGGFMDEDCTTWDWRPGRLDIEICDVKWYESYTDVQQFHSFLDALPDLGYAYEFIRLGEDDEDVARQSAGELYDSLLSVVRSVERI